MNRRVINALSCAALAGLILWGALTAVPPIPKLFEGQDKLEHFLAFGALTFWLTALVGPRRWLWAVVMATAGAIGLELAQAALTATREADFGDVLASVAGIGFSALFILAARRKVGSRSNQPV